MAHGNGNPLQCSCLKNPRDGEAWWAAIYGQTRLKWLTSSSSSSALFSLFLSKWIHFLPITLCLTEFFLWWDIKKVNCIKVLRPCVWSVSKPWVQVPIWVALFHNPYRFCTLAIMRACNLKSHVKCWLNPLIGSTKNIFLITLISLGEGNGNPLQYSCLENPVDGGAW